MSALDPTKLTPGVIDAYAQRAFSFGACHALAIALHDATGWSIIAITDASNVFEGKAGGGSALHWTVRRPDGKLIDIDGAHDAETLVEKYSGYADNGHAQAAASTRGDCLEWYEDQEVPIPISLARSFVIPVLALIAGEATSCISIAPDNHAPESASI